MRIVLSIGALVAASLFVMGIPRPEGRVAAGTAVRMDVPSLVKDAALIVEGRVLTSLALERGEGRVETEHLLEVERTFLGEDLPFRTVLIPGGVLKDGRGMLLAGMPRIEEGEELLLFLSPEAEGGVRMPVGLAQGKFRVVRRGDGSKLLEREGLGVRLVDPRTGAVSDAAPVATYDYAEVVAQIEAARARRR